MTNTETVLDTGIELTPERVREQLETLVQDAAFRSSKRSVEFLRYVVDETLSGRADQIKERTIGIEVFGRSPSYDTNLDHVVRTAAVELRKRLAIYYGAESHRTELRMTLLPGSYVPKFTVPESHVPSPPENDTLPPPPLEVVMEGKPVSNRGRLTHPYVLFALAAVAIVAALAGFMSRAVTQRSAMGLSGSLFWKPVFDSPGSTLIAVGDVPKGPPTPSGADSSVPILNSPAAPSMPFEDSVAMARVVGLMEQQNKKVLIRRESASSFNDLREGPAVLIGAFNNEWSLHLTHQLRYTLAIDPDKKLIYIKDSKDPGSRAWSWRTDQPVDRRHGAGGPVVEDYALISRMWNSDTGHMVIVLGGLYTYGTQTAGEFLTDPQFMKLVDKAVPPGDSHKNLQIILGTTVMDDTPGPPRVLVTSVE